MLLTSKSGLGETTVNDSSLCGCSPDLIKIQQSLKVAHGSAHVYLVCLIKALHDFTENCQR
jgi:hypothetical protein